MITIVKDIGDEDGNITVLSVFERDELVVVETITLDPDEDLVTNVNQKGFEDDEDDGRTLIWAGTPDMAFALSRVISEAATAALRSTYQSEEE